MATNRSCVTPLTQRTKPAGWNSDQWTSSTAFMEDLNKLVRRTGQLEMPAGVRTPLFSPTSSSKDCRLLHKKIFQVFSRTNTRQLLRDLAHPDTTKVPDDFIVFCIETSIVTYSPGESRHYYIAHHGDINMVAATLRLGVREHGLLSSWQLDSPGVREVILTLALCIFHGCREAVVRGLGCTAFWKMIDDRHEAEWEAKILRYFEYGSALGEGRDEVFSLMRKLEHKLPVELQDLILQRLVISLCPKAFDLVQRANTSGKASLPARMEDVLQHISFQDAGYYMKTFFADIQLVTKDCSHATDGVVRHSGFVYDMEGACVKKYAPRLRRLFLTSNIFAFDSFTASSPCVFLRPLVTKMQHITLRLDLTAINGMNIDSMAFLLTRTTLSNIHATFSTLKTLSVDIIKLAMGTPFHLAMGPGIDPTVFNAFTKEVGLLIEELRKVKIKVRLIRVFHGIDDPTYATTWTVKRERRSEFKDFTHLESMAASRLIAKRARVEYLL